MRSEANSLDLNNLPEDYTRDGGKQASGDSSSSAGGGGGCRKKKSGGGKDEKDEDGKVYECRFCSLKFCKSQALGGHMNRHRQERETETLNKARQLVFSNDLAPSPPPPHLGYVSSGQLQGGYHHHHHHQLQMQMQMEAGGSSNVDDAFRSIYPSRILSTSSTLAPPPPPPPLPPQTVPYAFPSPAPPAQLLNMPSQYAAAPPSNDYFFGHVTSTSCYGAPPNGSNYYTCIGGAPVTATTRDLDAGSCGADATDSSSLQQNQQDQEGINWGRR